MVVTLKKIPYSRKLSRVALFCHAKGRHAPKFRRENFRKWPQKCESPLSHYTVIIKMCKEVYRMACQKVCKQVRNDIKVKVVYKASSPLLPICTSHKKVFRMKTSTCRDETLKNQPNKMGTTPQHIHTIPTSCAILPTMFCVC